MNEKRVALLFTINEWLEIFSAVQNQLSADQSDGSGCYALSPILQRIEGMLHGEMVGEGH